MILNRIVIKNYRSIKDLSIPIKKINGYSLHTLLGINESGKSNILRAIFSMNNNAPLNYEQDCQKDARRKGDSIKISFIYELTSSEIDELEASLLKDKILIRKDTNEIRYIEKILTLNKNSEKNLEWSLIIPNNPSKFYFEENGAENQKIMREATVEELKTLLKKNEKGGFLEKATPKIVYWKASPEYLITNPINLDQFKQKKDINVPLKNLFTLIGISESQINSLIERTKADPSERRKVSKDISEKATKYINEIWPEHKISFDVSIESNSNCSVHIMDNDSEELFGMNERSDGFKQFISILLTLSAEFRSKTLSENIILIDEPEVNLHPSSIQFLRDELLKISQDNYLIVASHSIFMIDKKDLDRHIKVFKNIDGTKIEEISKDNPFAEEVIYRSLGTSIYEIIEPYILVFEGSIDKEIYDAFILKFGDEIAPPRLKTISATGVNEIRKYLKFFNQKTVTGIVLVDSDVDGRKVLRAIKENDKGFEKSSFEILDIVDLKKTEATLEDLFPIEIIKEAYFEIYDSELGEIKEEISIIKYIKDFKSANGINEDYDLGHLKILLSKKILGNMVKSKEEIKEKYPLYFKFFQELNKKVTGVQTISR